jgi:hypothetical protein
MHYQTEHALSRCRQRELMPIRCTMTENGNYYILRAANGDRRSIATGSAHTALANAHWPKYGKNAVLWVEARPMVTA